MKKHENGVIEYNAQDLIENYKKAYDKAKEAAVAAAQVSMPPLLVMENPVSYTHLTLPTTPYV